MTITFKRLDPSAAILLARGQECQWICVGECQLGSRIWLGGRAVLREGRHIDNEARESRGEGGRVVLSVLGPIRKVGKGGGGGGGCLPYDDLYLGL